MKTKTVFLSLLAGAFMCFSSASYAQGGHEGGGGSDAFVQGYNFIDVGVGFGSGLGNLYNFSGYSASVGPAIELSYEHALSQHWGIGAYFSYQSASTTYNYQGTNSQYVLTNYTDTYKESLIQFCARGAYHFTVGAKIDPYIGVNLGYCTISSSYSSNDPTASSTNPSSSLSGIEYGGFGGIRYLFSNHIGVWAELQFASASISLGNINGVNYTESINPCCIGNLGITFKF